jgi:ADP-ribose pyrophosphatase YjhB (NUDIX family)
VSEGSSTEQSHYDSPWHTGISKFGVVPNRPCNSEATTAAKKVEEVTGDAVAVAFVDQGYTGEQAAEDAQAHHMALCLVAYLIVERERLDRGLTWVRLKRHLILTGASEALPALERVRKAA